MSLFTRLFNKSRSEADGLKQEQREAIVDLLVYGMYVDNALSLSEESVLQAQVDGFAWEESSDVDAYTDRAITRVRAIRGSDAATGEFLASVHDRLGSYEIRLNAFAMLERLLAADGKADSEKAFLTRVRDALHLN